jgi:hypothetical protein
MPSKISNSPLTLEKNPLEKGSETPYQDQASDPTGKAMKAGPKETIDGKEEKKELTWLEVELVDQDGKPVEGEFVQIKLSDGTMAPEQMTGPNGVVRISGIPKGNCEVNFPRLYKGDWKKL